RPIRRLSSATHFKRVQNRNHEGPSELWLACSPGDPNAQSLTLDKISSDELCEPPVTMPDMLAALVTQKSTVGENELAKYQKFTQEFGQEAKSLAAECKATLISVNAWECQSKCLNYNEKCIKYLFELACERQPCILFIDDIDGLPGQPYDSDLELCQRIKKRISNSNETYSNADIIIVCREASFRALHQLISATHFKRIPNLKWNDPRKFWFACSLEDPNAEVMTIDKIEANELYIPRILVINSYENF
ncbi:unnamed protein product, partial [Rotaria sordida]